MPLLSYLTLILSGRFLNMTVTTQHAADSSNPHLLNTILINSSFKTLTVKEETTELEQHRDWKHCLCNERDFKTIRRFPSSTLEAAP